MKKKIDELILESLSFYTPLTIDQIILDLDDKKVKNIRELDLGAFEKRIKFFVKTKKVKVLKSDNRVAFIKLFPKRKLSLARFFLHFFIFFKSLLIKLYLNIKSKKL
ncbi:MAG: hypothetical protein CME68_11845 [Halobacteriovoraceae bacterium]|nr:hypothetical protein [Halobacteriovoraceae bacterium]